MHEKNAFKMHEIIFTSLENHDIAIYQGYRVKIKVTGSKNQAIRA